MLRGFLIVLLASLISVHLWAADLIIKRVNSVMRQGPASYYKVLCQLPVNTRVSEIARSEDWIEVVHKQENGFIAKSALTAKALTNDPFAAITVSSASSKVSQHSVTAGVKGFAQYYDSSYGFSADESFLDIALNYETDPAKFDRFNSETYLGSNSKAFRTSYPIPANNLPDYFSESHEGFGLAVAAVIAKQGLYKNPALTEYVGFVGQTLVLASEAGDIGFRFFVLDISQPNAYACPGGYVFVTKGMVQAVETEAELAFVLAHEIAHVTRFHGMIETKARENQIGAESLFAELDEDRPDAFSDKAKAVEEELEKDIMQMFEILVQGRLDEYEMEADQLALHFMARAGYLPSSSIDIMTRLVNTRYESNNQHYRKDSVRERLERINKGMVIYRQNQPDFFSHRDRLQRYKALLDQ